MTTSIILENPSFNTIIEALEEIQCRLENVLTSDDVLFGLQIMVDSPSTVVSLYSNWKSKGIRGYSHLFMGYKNGSFWVTMDRIIGHHPPRYWCEYRYLGSSMPAPNGSFEHRPAIQPGECEVVFFMGEPECDNGNPAQE